MHYRPEVDGLRALAVIPVILFHAGISGFSGGYVGVDIFFVISGYLITSIILKDVDRRRFSLWDFYERRARRILPALTLVVACSTIAAYLFMPPNYLTQYAQSVVAVMLFAANIYFYLTTNYFSTEADEKPLLHTWSLGVEEQFYLFFPLMVMALAPWGRKALWRSLILLSLLSLGFAHYLLAQREFTANFFLIFSRAWELALGAMVAMLPLSRVTQRRQLNQAGGLLGLVAIIFAIVFYDVDTPFPSVYTLAPVLGACLLIVFAQSGTVAWQLLSWKPMVAIGLVSYSLYLWHQPLFAFLRLKWIGEPPVALFLLASALTGALAVLTWRYIEQPFRDRRRYSRRAIFVSSGAVLCSFIAIGLAGHATKGYNARATVDYSASIKASPKRDECHSSFGDKFDPEHTCRYFGKQITWAAFGDSHMVEPAYALARRLEPLDQGVMHFSYSMCPPALLFDVNVKGCHQWIKDVLSYLENDKAIENVLLGFRYGLFLYGDQLNTYPETPNENPADKIATDKSLSAEQAREFYWQSLSALVDQLLAAGKRVYVLYPVPELPLHVEKAVFPVVAYGSETPLPLGRAVSAEYYKARNEFILGKLDSLPYSDRLIAVKPFDIFCRDGYCPVVRDGKALYFDDDHLSIAGASMVVDAIDATTSFENMQLSENVDP